jgi:hypothetical protein
LIQKRVEPEILKAKQLIWVMSKVTDIDRPKGIFTDYRHAGDFIRPVRNKMVID